MKLNYIFRINTYYVVSFLTKYVYNDDEDEEALDAVHPLKDEICETSPISSNRF